MKKTTFTITQAALIAALYVVLTLLANALGLANYAIQLRFSEALTILPFFLPAAVPGLFVGCILSNLLTGCLPLDVIFGSLATLLGALGTLFLGRSYRAGMKNSFQSSARELSPARETADTGKTTPVTKPASRIWWLAPVPPIVANTLIVPFVLAYVYHFEGSIPYFMLTVGLGEVLSCGVLGLLLFKLLERYRKYIFPQTE